MNKLSHYQKLFLFALKGNKGFYEAREYMAEILLEELEEFIDLKNKKVIDIGGERGEFCKILKEKRNCDAINLEPQKLKFVHKTINGTADKLPFEKETFDLVLLRGVIQHIPTEMKLKSLQEMKRVLKKDGIAYVMIPPWWNPLSAQRLKPFQYFGFNVAKHLSITMMKRDIPENNLVEMGLWPMTITSTKKYLHHADFKIIKTIDIIGRMHFLVNIPIVNEFLLSSVGFVAKKMLK